MPVMDLVRIGCRQYPFTRGRSRMTQFLSRAFDLTGVVSVALAGDESIPIELNLDQFVSRQIYWFSCFEPTELGWFSQFLERDMVVIDIGANIGQYTLLAAALVGSAGAVHSFEPDPRNLARLTRNVKNNRFGDRVLLNAVALTRDEGAWELVPAQDGGNSYIRRASSDGGNEVIETTSVDYYCDAKGLSRVDFIKCDTEGADLEVLRGAHDTLERYMPVLLVEVACRHLQRFGATPQELLDYLSALGYRAHRIVGMVAEPIESIAAGSDQNILFVPNGTPVPKPLKSRRFAALPMIATREGTL